MPLEALDFDPFADDAKKEGGGAKLEPLDFDPFDDGSKDLKSAAAKPTPNYWEMAQQGEAEQRQADMAPAEFGRKTAAAAGPTEDSLLTLGRKAIENAGSAAKEYFGARIQGAGTPSIANVYGAAEGGMAPLDYSGDLGKVAGQVEESRRTDPNAVMRYGKAIYDAAAADIKANAPNVNDGSLKSYSYQAAESVIQMLPTLATAIATRNPTAGLAVMGEQTYGQQYGQAVNEDKRTPEQARLDASFYAMAETIPEEIPLEVLMKPGGKFLPRLLKTMGAEALQEMFTQVLETGYDKGTVKPDMTWGEAWGQVRDAGIVGAMVGGGMAAVEAPFHRGEGGQTAAGAAVHEVPKGVLAETQNSPVPVTPGDVASPLDTGTIAEGKQIMAEALASQKAGDILSRNGWPDLGARVTVDRGNGPEPGSVADAFQTEVPELGAAGEGIRINLDSGASLEAFRHEIERAGIRIAPEALAPVTGVDPTATPAPAGQPLPLSQTPASEAPDATAGLLTKVSPEGTPAPQPIGDGTQAAPVQVAHPDHVELAAARVNTAPTEGQKEAGNYEKGHLRLHGLDISIENPKGSTRSGVGADGEPWSVELPAHYGYIKRSVGADEEHVDVYIGPNPESQQVFVIDQVDDNGAFDEHKVMLGFHNKVAAVEAYRAAFSDGKGLDRMGGFHEVPIAQFRMALKDPALWKRSFVEQKGGSFRTSAGAIETEHQAEVSAIEAEGTKAAEPRKRAYPSYTTEQLKKRVADLEATGGTAGLVAPIKAEIAAREAGLSKPKVTPQIGPGFDEKGDKIEKPAKPEVKKGEKKVGFNNRGMTVYEDENGVRSVSERGVRMTEPVEIIPTRDRGMVAAPNVAKRSSDFLTREEHDQRQAEQAKADRGAEIAKNADKGTESGDRGIKNDEAASRKKPADYGSKNKIFTQEERAAAAARIRNRLKNQLNAGLDPEMLADGIKVAGYHIEAGARSFIDYATAMLEELGEGVRPYLKAWYSAIYSWPGIDGEGMTSPERITPEMIETVGKEPAGGVQKALSGSDEAAGAEDVQRAGALGEDGRAPAGEVGGGPQSVRQSDEGRAPAAERGAARLPEGERDRAPGARDADRLPAAVGRSGADRREPGPHAGKPDAGVSGTNYSIVPGGLQEGRSFRQKARDNIAAIKILRELANEARPATRAEQDKLALYVGWGGIKGAFPDGEGKFSKGFEEIGAELKKLLSDSEYKTAQRSIQYAHYTAEKIVRAMWATAQRMGFEGGQVFEPGMGVGNFAGMMPPDVAAVTKYSGLEMDHTTAAIAKALYPEWGVRQEDFTKAPLPKDTYDLVIGNPPFADVTVKTDPAYAKHGFLLHDYFFAKSLDAVRPGGLLAFITSAGTMNKLDTKAREYLADRAELVGAVRLPGDAFKENAGTQVTTDIIFLRKLLPGEESSDRSWTETSPVTLPTKDGGTKAGAMSRYFADHPDMVLGEQGFFDKLLPGRYGVRADGRDFEPALTKALESLPGGVMKPWNGVRTASIAADFSGGGQKKEGSYYLKDGELHQMRQGVGRQVERRGAGVTGGKTAAEIQRIKGLIPIRDALRDVYAADLKEDGPAADKARKALNAAYDAFFEKYGAINKAEFQYRRPTSIQHESARQAMREEARFSGQPFDDGSFDPEPLLRANAKLAEIARARAAAKEAAEKAGRPWDEGTYNPEDQPDIVIDRRPNVGPFMEDPESYRLRSIEKYNDQTGESQKGKVFYENVVSKPKAPEIKTVGDALLHSLNAFGRVDIPEIARRVGMSESEAIEKLGDAIFRKPGTDGTWETREQYLSGNVRQKLREAQAAAESNPSFQRNVDALKAVQPAPLPPSEIAANLGMPWIPPDVIRDFATAADGLGLERAKVNYVGALAQWSVEADQHSAAATATWGTSERPAGYLLLDALNRQDPKIYDTVYVDGQRKQVLNPTATQAAQDKVKEIKQKFRDWIWTDQTRADRLVGLYNENYNNMVVPQYDGSYLTTPGIAEGWKWRPHQTRVIARIIQAGNTYMAHAVGAGKTSAMIASGMEMRRLGLVRKNMFAVPNHMLGQFTKEFYEQYPTAKIMVADEQRFHTDTRKQFISDVANEDLDAVVITHSAFGMIPVSPEFQDGLINEQIEQYRELLEELGKDQETRITRGKVENAIEKLEQRLGGNAKRQDQTFTFEEMGIDHLFVDEAHLFRKLDFATKMSNVKGVSPEGSKASWDLYVKARYLETKNPGHSLVLASGTPVTNTMAELYTVSRYLQPAELAARGLSHFDAWASAFGDTDTALEQNAAGGYKATTRFSKFVNVPELSAMVRQMMDVVTSKQLAQYVTRPELEGGKRRLIIAEKSERLEAYQGGLARRMTAIEKRKGPPKKGDDIMLTVINDGRHAAIDMRLVDPTLPKDPGSKLELLIDEVFGEWKATAKQPLHAPGPNGYSAEPVTHGPATQMIFANLGIGDGRAFNVHKYIVSELVRRGVPRSEIAIITDYKNHTARQRLFNDMNDGKVRVLIGSTAKMATGVNAQKRLSTINNLDPLWYPADDEQRNGRGLRQGNMNPLLKIKDYSTKGTYDSTMWGMMERKARFIQAFFEGDPSIRDMEDLGEASQYEQAKAITTNDPRLITLTEDKQELEKERRRAAAFEREQYAIRDRIRSAEDEAARSTRKIAAIEKDIAQAEDTAGDNFKASVGGEDFDERVKFGEALQARGKELAATNIEQKKVKVGRLGGFDLTMDTYQFRYEFEGKPAKGWAYQISLARNGGYSSFVESQGKTAVGLTRTIEGIVTRMPAELEDAKRTLAQAEADVRDFTPKLGGTFDTSKMRDLAERVAKLEGELAAEAAAAQAAMAAAAGPEEAQPKASRFGGNAEPMFYSALTRGVQGIKTARAPAADWKGTIANLPGVKKDEIEWSGIEGWLDQQTGPVTKEAVLDYLRANEVQVQEVMRGDDAPREVDPRNRRPQRGEMAAERFDDLERRHTATAGEDLSHGEARMLDWLDAHPNATDLEFLTREYDIWLGEHPGYVAMSADELAAELEELAHHEDNDSATRAALLPDIAWLRDFGRRWDQAADNERGAESARRNATLPTKYKSYKLPGGENYRELLLTLPQHQPSKVFSVRGRDGNYYGDFDTRAAAEDWAASRNRQNRGMGAEVVERQKASNADFQSSHWDEPNILAHIRFDDRTGPNGEKVLHVAEIQSDWHQRGRRSGYRPKPWKATDLVETPPREGEVGGGDKIWFEAPDGERAPGWQTVAAERGSPREQALKAINLRLANNGGVPDAPFKTTWQELAFKRMVRYAAENGYDRLSWDTGNTNADRYSLRKQIKNLHAIKDSASSPWDLAADLHNGRPHHLGWHTSEDLEDVVGKEMARKILTDYEAHKAEGRGRERFIKDYRGVDLEVGGEGMKGFYDGILPKFANKYLKKWGVKVEPYQVSAGDLAATKAWKEQWGEEGLKTSAPAHSVAITPEMRESVMQGQPLFSRTGTAERPDAQAFERIKAALQAKLAQLGLDDKITLEVLRKMTAPDGGPADGLYWRGGGLMQIAISTRNPFTTMKHEAIHALRDLGLFREAEWRALERAARANTALWAEMEEAYGGAGIDLTDAEKVEEVIAEMFARWKPEAPSPTLVRRAYERVAAFFRALKEALTQSGYTRPEDLFAAVDRGEIGRRGEPIDWVDEAGTPQASKFGKLGDNREVEPVRFGNGQSEDRFQQARAGIGNGPGLKERTKEWLTRVGNGFTRHFIALPNDRRFSDVTQQLRKLEAAPESATGEVVRTLEKMVGDMNAAELDLFTRKVVLDDLAWEAQNNHDLPFGLSAIDVPHELAKVDAALAKRPDIMERVRQRKLAVLEVADRMVKAGVLDAERVKNPAYYRHQVLDYAHAMVKQGTSGRLQKPRWAKRLGSTRDINANFLEAEFDWLHKALVDIQTAKTIQWIKESELNIRDEVVGNAKAHNKGTYDGILARDMRDNGYTTPTGRQTSPLNEIDMEFRRSIAMGLGNVHAALESGYLDPIPPEFDKAALAIGAKNMDDSVFPFLAWIMDNRKDAAMGAAQVFKGVSGRKQFMKDLLGDKYADPTDIDELLRRGFGKDGYVTWQPDEGKLLYTAKTLAEHTVDSIVSRSANASDGEIAAMFGIQSNPTMANAVGEFAKAVRASARDALVVAGQKYQLVIPEELAATLNSLRDPVQDDLLNTMAAVPMRLWKQWTLINPRRVVKYNLNNLSGDLDAVIAGQPKVLLRAREAARELLAVYKGGVPSARFREALDRGVFSTGLTIQEIPDIQALSQFEHLFNKASDSAVRVALRPAGKFWRALQDMTQLRENILRYAAYLHYADALEGGKTVEDIGYGASNPELVDGVKDLKDKAGLLARDLLGDYGAISAYGQGIRRKLIPFYSWMEINAKRYVRLATNAYGQGIGKGLATSGVLGAALGVRTTGYLAVRAFALYGLIQLFNWLFHDDEMRKMDPEEQTQLRVILGEINGELVTLRLQGALSDFLSWFGLEDAVATMQAVDKGRAGWGDVLGAMAKAPVNKVASGMTPALTTPLTLSSGMKFWPDVFNPRPVRDRWRELFQTFSLENEYDAVAARPSRGYLRSWINAGVYTADPGEMAYNRIVGLAHDWEANKKGTSSVGAFITPRSQALYDWRRALRYGDERAAHAALEKMRELGVKAKDRGRSLKAMHPLGNLSTGKNGGPNERVLFLKTLSPEERAELNQAMEWYRDSFLAGARTSVEALE